MKDLMGVLLTLAGAALLYVGYEKYDSALESAGRFFGQGSSNEVKAFLLGGAACLLVGLATLGMGRLAKKKK